MNGEVNLHQVKMMLLKSLFDYKHANDGASYQLPKVYLEKEPDSERAIDQLLAEGFAENTSEDDTYLLLHITDSGVQEVKNVFGM